jgi:hypothetical protein
MPAFTAFLFLCAIVPAAICVFRSFQHLRRKRLMDDIPTSKTRGVFIGLTELKGTAESEAPVISKVGNTPCVAYTWHVEEQNQHMVTESRTDSKGKRKVRTRVKKGWVTVAASEQLQPFYLKDDTGIIRILPDRATVYSSMSFTNVVDADSSARLKELNLDIKESDNLRRFYETGIPLHTYIYVIGQARARQDIAAAEIAYDDAAPVFLITTKTESEEKNDFGKQFWKFQVFGYLLALLAVGFIDVFGVNKPGLGAFLICTGAYAAVNGLGWLWTIYNGLVGLRQRVQQAWSQVDIQLKRRNDLIPNLVTVIEGYREHEQEIQQYLAEIRRQLNATAPGLPGEDYKGLTARLLALMERYPEFKASEMFLKLQKALVDTEERIALARDYYNNVTTFYNTRLKIFPDRFVASLASCRPRPLMDEGYFERAQVDIKLAE